MVNLNFYSGKRVFITGHTGFKGSWLTEILLNSGADVTGYALAPNTNPNLFELLSIEDKITHIEGDIRDLAKLSAAMSETQPEIVFHLAAQPLVRESYARPVDTYSTNVMGTVNVLEAMRSVGSVKSFVNVTTDKVYLNRERQEGYTEDEVLCGYDPYSNSKSCSELVTYSYKNSFFHQVDSPAITTARSGNVIGGGDFSADRIVPDCVRATMENQKIVVRNPFSTRPYQHVLDCLSGYLVVAEQQFNDKNLASNYNFGPNDEDCVTTGDLADLFCEFWQGAGWINKYDGGPHEANFLKLDITKSKKVLGWQPTWGIKTAMQKTVEWYKTFADGKDVAPISDKQIKEFFNK